MCGIVGHLSFASPAIEPAAVSIAADTLAKRGPDDSGLWFEEGMVLGHRRLSVLDLSAAGHQPMLSHDGRYVIVHNGEIYNFRELREELDTGGPWLSDSDTEVILAAFAKWGVECLSRLRGMFAFAIWDRKERVLFAARDRLGVKPLYYHHSNKNFAFASRPRALHRLPLSSSREIDAQALRFYFEMGHIPSPYSIFKHIRTLPPGHYLVVKSGEVDIKRYWDFSHIRPEPSLEKRSQNDLLDELDELIRRSVQLRLVSDVPLGAFLSGGIDSSLVVGMMTRISAGPVKTFTIGFNEKRYDESANARAVSDHLRTDHHCEFLDVDELLRLLPLFQQEFDEPFFDSSAFATMAVSRMARKRVTVSLTGDGGDELFGGYHYYQILQRLDPFFSLPAVVRGGLASIIGLIPRHRLKLLAGALRQKDAVAAFAFARSISKDFHPILVPDVLHDTQGIFELFEATSRVLPEGLHPCEMAMRLDMHFILPAQYLQKVDVSSMAFSLELRNPLLDAELVEWSMKLPLSWNLRSGTNKYLLRQLAYRYVPKEILNRPKRGFDLPLDRWLRGPLKEWAAERLNSKSLFSDLPIDQSVALQLFDMHQSGIRNVHPLLWAILMLLSFFSDGEGRGATDSRPYRDAGDHGVMRRSSSAS